MTRQFKLFSTYEAAQSGDASVCNLLRVRDGSRASQWAGVSVRDDGSFGVFWDSPCVDVFGSAEDNFLDTEIIAEDGTSNWKGYLPPPDPIIL